MEASDELRGSAPAGSVHSRRRSISIVEAEELSGHTPKQFANACGTGNLLMSPLLHPPLRSDTNTNRNNSSGSSNCSSTNASATVSPSAAAVSHAPTFPGPRSAARPDEPGASTGSNAVAGDSNNCNGGISSAHSTNPTPDRTSLFRGSSHRTASMTAQMNTNNTNGHATITSQPNLGGNSPTPSSWRRSLLANSNSGGVEGSTTIAAAAAVAAAATVMSGSTATAAGGTSFASRQHRQSSLMYRRPSSATFGSHGINRSAGVGTASGMTPTNVSAGNVYTLQLTEDDGGVEMGAARPLLLEALHLRDSYKGLDKGQLELGGSLGGILVALNNNAGGVNGNNTNNSGGGGMNSSPTLSSVLGASPMAGMTALQQVDGVFYWTDEKTPIVSWAQFTSDVMAVATCVQNPSCLSLAKYRLQVLEEKFHLHRLYNAEVEENGDRYRRGGGLYANSCRVDNCVAASTVMNAHWLVEYIQQTVDACGGDVVNANVNIMAVGGGTDSGAASDLNRNGSVLALSGDAQTLERACELLDFPDPYQLTVEGLGLQPSVGRALPYYDALDPALNGSGRNSAALLRIFLTIRGTSSTPQKGDYLAGAVLPSLTRNELRTSCPQATEMTLEISGVLTQEWEQTAAWVRANELDSYRTNQFQISFPITKWCGGSGGDGRYGAGTTTAGTAPAIGGIQNRPDDVPGGVQQRGSESQRLYKVSGSDNVGPGDPTAAPEDILAYDNYQQLLDHLFLPLFMATLAPEDPKFVDLASLLQHTGAILLTGDETTKTRDRFGGGDGGNNDGSGGGGGRPNSNNTDAGRGGGGPHGPPLTDGVDLVDANGNRHRPADVPYTEPVSLTYMCYHIWANLCSLNALRRRRGLNVLQLRVVASNALIPNTSSPHDASLLLLSYLIADVVVDGVALDKQPVLQYLYGLNQVGVTMCPMARGSLGTTSLSEHPLARLLWRGLRVSLCTISPLYYHSSQEPLLEEYATAAKSHRLSPTDISELSLHSVCMSAFDEEIKASWVGMAFLREGWRANVPELTSVPTARLQMRYDSWTVERKLLLDATPSPSSTPCGAGAPTTGLGDATDFTAGTLSRMSKRDSTVNSRSREMTTTTVSTGNNRYSGVTPLRPAGSAAGTGGQQPAATVTTPVQQASPYTVLDPAVDFPRLFLVGPYERDIANAHIAQSLHRALDLRHQYSALPLAQPSTLPPCEASIEAAAGVKGSKVDVRNNWLAALIHDPQAALPHPTQSMSWAFKKTPLAPPVGGAAAGAGAVSSPTSTTAHSHLPFDEDEWKYKTVEGIIVPHEVHQIPRLPQDVYHYEDFCRHVQEIRHLIDHIRVREFALRRLQLLEHRFNLHAAVNHSLELGSTAERASQNRDFYQSTKVDNNIRMETGMTARQLLAFIVDKATHNGDDIVSHPKGKEPQTLRQLLSELHISPSSLTVDDLNIQAGATSSDGGAPHNPFSSEGSQDELLTLLLKTDNQMNGRYFAELTKRTFEELSRDQHTFTESRLPVYGASAGEWGLLSHWFDTHGMSSSHNQWVVQVPRIYSSLRKAGRVASFADYLEHIFEPLWRISLHPNSDPRLFHFVNHIAAFDCVEDERRPDMPLHRATRAPHEWTSEEEPPYNYYLYHLYANLRSLNRFRQRRRFSVFAFRPSCGEAGSIDHLIGGFLLAQNINYGVRLADSAPLQYLFYLAQIGVTLSPLSNNTKLDLNYLHNPFPEFFRRGLRVSLGTDSPLLYHHTQEPLLEEYSIASKIWKLSPNDLSEVARNSVLLSNFSVTFKEEKLGPLYFLSSSAGNDVTRTHLSDVRVAYRFETYHTEVGFLEYISGQHFHRALLTLAMETQCKQLCGVVDKNVVVEESEERGKKTAKKVDNSVQLQGEKGGGNRSLGSYSPPPRSNDVLIDPTPKEADVKQLEQQRARMQRQLLELTNAVADLHKQNRLLTTKLGEERERDQQAAQLRRHRVGDKLRELQVLLDQKQVQPHAIPTEASSTAQLQQQGSSGAVMGAAAEAVNGVASQQHLVRSPTSSFGDVTAQPFTGGAAATSVGGVKSSNSSDTTANAKAAAVAEGPLSSPSPVAAVQKADALSHSALPASSLASQDVFSTVRNRKAVPREAAIAQTQRLLGHSESLWRSSSSSQSPAKTENILPSLQRKR